MKRNAAAASKPRYGEAIFEGNNYPRSWAEYIGQERAKLQLRVAIASAVERNARLDHTLIASGTPGIGKTALSLLTAHQLGVGVVEVSGTMSLTDAVGVLKNMSDRDVLFIDEIHRLADGGKKNVEWMLHLLQDGVLMMPTGALVIPDITVIGATTDAQRLPPTILDRFLVRPQIVPYSEDEAVQIVAGMAKRQGFGRYPLVWPERDDWLRRIARAGVCNPRKMHALLVTVRDLGLATAGGNYLRDKDTYDLDVPLDWHGLTPDGLDPVAVKYLVALAEVFNGTAGEKAIANAIGEPGGCSVTEQLLTAKGFLTRGPRGRTLTEEGWDRAQELARPAAA